MNKISSQISNENIWLKSYITERYQSSFEQRHISKTNSLLQFADNEILSENRAIELAEKI